MAKQPFISHAVNGYSRYDVPESKAFTCTPGILYPVRIDFINARDRVTISQGIDVRSNPLAVPTFNPYTVRLHRFWVPIQLYHPEMRTNSSKFDMNNLSLNWIRSTSLSAPYGIRSAFPNSLMYWLRIGNKSLDFGDDSSYNGVSLPNGARLSMWSNADSYLAYWDIVRNYYSFPQWSLYSFAWPARWRVSRVPDGLSYSYVFPATSDPGGYFNQRYGNLEYLDAFFESQFYPNFVSSTNNTYNRGNLFWQILNSDTSTSGVSGNGYPVSLTYPSDNIVVTGNSPSGQFSSSGTVTDRKTIDAFLFAHPMAVVPSNPDRFSRLIPPGQTSNEVSLTGVTTIPQLAVASRMQEYKDLLGAGGSRFSDWLETFFASKIEHVDRPKLLFSASQTVNVQVVMNTSGQNNFSGSQPLGQMGGSIAFNTQLGRSQSYYFKEPGYMIDMLSIRPVYYWSCVTPDYLDYKGSDYFNPIYNDIGYQSVPYVRFANPLSPGESVAVLGNEPCFNEFRSSYDEVLGMLAFAPDYTSNQPPLYSYWVQQRSIPSAVPDPSSTEYYPMLFVDMKTVNSPFASNVEDNFFVNMSYSVVKKNLVNKTFATRLSNR